ncbi:universal stress protein family protein [Klebsormidium nitens]|uniref:Universal stress protein family protein n=1 Tax=Klebsormidium nitens TaxID=105231 RepID=A0A1Y1HZ82_KLENI|nr:universal stress protein family protein [Klebsormidium nitens]|eukprot:GAQ83964.1 universal stress protein family protein [Klebsormidium nitens]
MADTIPAASAAAQQAEEKQAETSEPSEVRPARSAGGRRIVCGIDGSEGSFAAFKFVRETLVNPERGDRVTLVRAFEPMNPEEAVYSDHERRILQEEDEARRKEARHELQQLSELAGTIIEGDPPDAIQEYVAMHPVDMLVVGNRGLSAVARLFLGSVGSHLVANSPVPVTVVPQAGTAPMYA